MCVRVKQKVNIQISLEIIISPKLNKRTIYRIYTIVSHAGKIFDLLKDGLFPAISVLVSSYIWIKTTSPPLPAHIRVLCPITVKRRSRLTTPFVKGRAGWRQAVIMKRQLAELISIAIIRKQRTMKRLCNLLSMRREIPF